MAETIEEMTYFSPGILGNAGAPTAGTSEVQTLTIGGTPSGGSITLSYNGNTTGAIAWSSTNSTFVANIQTALNALSTIGANTTVAVGAATSGVGTFTITFSGDLARRDVSPLSVASALTGTSPTAAIAVTTPGVTATGFGARRGQLLVDSTNGLLYINTGTNLSAPTWTKVGTQT